MATAAYTPTSAFGNAFVREVIARLAPASTPGCRIQDYPEEELARIRIALHRVAVLRVSIPEDAEDIVQETILTMILKCPQVDLEKGLLIWGMGILRKKIGNHYRRPIRTVPLDQTLGADGEFSACLNAGNSQEGGLHYSELCGIVDRVLDGFQPRERAALDLFLAGLPTHEIAGLLYPERYQTVVNWLHRGRKKLARELAKYGYGSLYSR